VDMIRDRKLTLSKFSWIGIEWAFLCYFVVVIIGFVFNASPDAEVSWQLSKFSWVINLYIYIYALGKLNLSSKKIVYFFSLTFLIPNIYAVFTYVYDWDFLTKKGAPRVIGMVNSATYHAHSNAVLFVVFCGLLYFGWKHLNPKIKVFSLAAAVIFFLSIFLTFTRGIWISLFVSALIIFSTIHLRAVLTTLLAGMAVFLACYMFWPAFHDRVNPANSMESSSERINLIKVNLQMWQENPLFGIGYGENMRRNREYWDQPQWNMPAEYITSHAHNQYINVLSTTGVFGLFFFLCFMGYFVKRNVQMLWTEKNKASLKYALIFACLWAQIEFLLACVTDVTFEYAKIRALFLFVWALLVVLDRNTIKLQDEVAP
jgi:O-antigen ligase